MYSRLQNEVPHLSASRPAEAWRGRLCRRTPGPLRSGRSSPHVSGVESPDWTTAVVQSGDYCAAHQRTWARHAGAVGWDGVGDGLPPRVSELRVVRLSRQGRWVVPDSSRKRWRVFDPSNENNI